MEKQEIKITIVQSEIFWEKPETNLGHFGKLISAIDETTDLIVLPEMFATGFTMKPELWAEENGGKSLEWMQEKAKEKNCVITGSLCVKEGEAYFNRLYWVKPNGDYSQYDKRHLFRMAKENDHYQAGTKKINEEIKGWKICPLICYDLRFPVWSRNQWTKNYEASYDLLLYVANWPEVRSYPWKQLLIARAIENQAYVCGVNRIGKDGNGIAHSGDSMLLNPRGEIISTTKAHLESVETITLSADYLNEFRKQFPVGNDADEFRIS